VARGLFIAGTDTGVGKTLVTAALGLALRVQGIRAGAMKPIETGIVCEPMPDSLRLKSILGLKEPIEALSPYRFADPLAPAVAAYLEGRNLELAVVAEAFEALLSAYELILVEGVGGLLVPLAPGIFVSDLIAFLGLDVLLVARKGLGTINHTLLSLEALEAKGLRCVGVVLNDTEGKGGLAESTNPKAIQGLIDVPLLGVFPYLSEKEREDVESLKKAAIQSLDIKTLLSGALPESPN
jgi:dethiobiotin synthetase